VPQHRPEVTSKRPPGPGSHPRSHHKRSPADRPAPPTGAGPPAVLSPLTGPRDPGRFIVEEPCLLPGRGRIPDICSVVSHPRSGLARVPFPSFSGIAGTASGPARCRPAGLLARVSNDHGLVSPGWSRV
jgi:hypothetical protein